MEITNFEVIYEDQIGVAVTETVAEVDVTRGWWFLKDTCRERIRTTVFGDWYFEKTGALVPRFKVDALYRAWYAAQREQKRERRVRSLMPESLTDEGPPDYPAMRRELADLIDYHQTRMGSFVTPANMAEAILEAGFTK